MCHVHKTVENLDQDHAQMFKLLDKVYLQLPNIGLGATFLSYMIYWNADNDFDIDFDLDQILRKRIKHRILFSPWKGQHFCF